MTFYHGTSTALSINFKLLPPEETKNISETGRKKNLNKVFMTDSKKYAQIYAGRSCSKFGGIPIVYRVIPFGTKIYQKQAGCNIFTCDYAFCEKLQNNALENNHTLRSNMAN